MSTFGSTRFLLAGIAASALLALGIAAVRSHVMAESPRDLALQAIAADTPAEQSRAATRLAALAAKPPAGAGAEVITGLRNALANGHTPEVRAAAIVGLARTGDRSVLPVLVGAIEDDNPLVAGRAIAAVQHMLGVRYGVDERLPDQEERRRVAAMAQSDMAALDGPGRAWWEAHTLQGKTW
jgi:hypothetical protein